MPRIELPDGHDSESLRLMQLQPAMGNAMGVLADAIYNKSSLNIRVREAVRMRIAQLNQCQICLSFRFEGSSEHGIDEAFYAHVNPINNPRFSAAEKLSIEFAERFAKDHTSIDDAFSDQLKAHFSDTEIAGIECGALVGLIANGRVLQVLQVDQMCTLTVWKLSITGTYPLNIV